MQIETYTLPSSWASALINGDETGLNDHDQAALDSFTADMVSEHGKCWAVDCSEESWFAGYHDAWHVMPLAGDVLEFTFDVTPAAPTLFEGAS